MKYQTQKCWIRFDKLSSSVYRRVSGHYCFFFLIQALIYATSVSTIIYTSDILLHLKNVLPFFFQGPLKPVRGVLQLHPFSYGEGIELDPLPPKELR